MKHGYRAYGLSVAADRLLPGWRSAPLPFRPDLAIHLGRLPSGFPLRRLQRSKPWAVCRNPQIPGAAWLTVWQDPKHGSFCFDWASGATFVVSRDGGELWAEWPAGLPFEEVLPYLTGNMMSFVLRLRGYLCLHAGAIVVDGQALLLGGAQGAGKSTLTAAFASRGFAVLDDDLAAIRIVGDQLLVYPAYPRIGLWPASVEALLGPRRKLPRLHPDEEKVALPLGRGRCQFAGKPAPLAAIYVMGERLPAGSSPRIEPVVGAQAVVALLTNHYGVRPPDPQARAAEFREITRVAATPIRRVHRAADLARVGDLCQAVLDDFRSLSPLPRRSTGKYRPAQRQPQRALPALNRA